jgi:hypothetical protein
MVAHTFTKQVEKNAVCQRADCNCYLGQGWKGVLMVEIMKQGTTILSQMHCETLKKTV